MYFFVSDIAADIGLDSAPVNSTHFPHDGWDGREHLVAIEGTNIYVTNNVETKGFYKLPGLVQAVCKI